MWIHADLEPKTSVPDPWHFGTDPDADQDADPDLRKKIFVLKFYFSTIISVRSTLLWEKGRIRSRIPIRIRICTCDIAKNSAKNAGKMYARHAYARGPGRLVTLAVQGDHVTRDTLLSTMPAERERAS